MIGYDLDGVLCEKYQINKKYASCNKEERKTYLDIKDYHYINTNKIFTPTEKEYIIITARTLKYKDTTLNWLKNNNITPVQIQFFEGNRRAFEIKDYKLRKITELGVDTFYEDDERIVKFLKKHLKTANIIHKQPVIRLYNIEDFRPKVTLF